jgi:hypothetical protein
MTYKPVGIDENGNLPPRAVAALEEDFATKDELTAAAVAPGTYATPADVSAAVASKAPLASPAFTGTPTGITKAHVGLGNVDNTSDASKPVSTAQAAINATKAPLASPAFTGTPTGITKSHVGLGNVDNTSDANKPISTAQAAVNSAQATTNAAKADLVNGVVPTSQIPPIALGNPIEVTGQAAMLALTSAQAQKGDVAVYPNAGGAFMLGGTGDPSVLSNWYALSVTGTTGVTSINTQTGNVVLGKADVGLGNVDNTTDANKPVSTAQAAINATKAPLASPAFTGTPTGITKAHVGLSNVDNTSDANKPVSTAQAAINATKAPLASPAFTGTPTGITKAHVGLGNVDNTADVDKPVSSAVTTALGLKVDKSDLSNQIATVVQGSYTAGTTSRFGWSGNDIPNVENMVRGVWMARDTWERVKAGQWLSADSGHTAYIAAHPDRAVDIGTAFIPHDSGVAIDTLLDQVINNTSVQVTTGGTMMNTADVLISLGKNLSLQGPAAGIVYSRPYWEMNMSPNPANSITRQKFIDAWNIAIPLIRQGFEAQKVTSNRPNQVLKIVFCPISDGADYTTFYPDNANVDIIAQDTYGAKWGSTLPDATTIFNWVKGFLDALTTFAISKGKPLALGEWGNWQQGTAGTTNSHGLGDGPTYIDQIFDWVDAQKNHATSKVEYLVYFNQSGGGVGITLADQPLSTARIQARVNGVRANGLVSKASAAEALAGSDDAKFLTAASVKAIFDAKMDEAPVINPQTGTAYTAALSDGGRTVTLNNASAVTVTIPTNATAAFPIGIRIDLINLGAGQVTVAGASGVTLIGGAYRSATGHAAVFGVQKVATDTWVVYGDVVA